MFLFYTNKKKKLKRENMGLIREKKFQMKKKFKLGDILVLEFDKKLKKYDLSQIPEVNGGLVVLENNTGRILAMVGGYDSSSSFQSSDSS